MKIILLQPPIQDFYQTEIRLQPIGLCYLKATVQKFLPGIQVNVKDYHHGWGRKTLAVPHELMYLKDYYPFADKSPFCAFFHYFHFGAPYETIADEIAALQPDLVGISSLFSPYHREALAVAAAIKKKISVNILMGGSHVSAMPEEVLRHPAVDFIIRGEGEKPLVELIRCLKEKNNYSKVPNLGYKKGSKIILNPIEDNYPLEELPLPDLSDTPAHRYLYEKKPLSFLVTSRSCPHRCSFCSVHQTFGFRFRRRSIENVLREIQLRYEEGVRVFDFEDDNLTYYQNAMKELCEHLIQMFPERDVQFLAMNGISYLSLQPELLSLMRRAGFTHLNIALVSSDTTVRETTKRPHTVEKYLEVVHEAHRLGFHIVSYQILGLPNETLDSMIQTLTFSARLPVLLGASMFYLTPHSPIARDFPAPTESDVFKARLTAMAIETSHFSRQDIYTLFVTTRIFDFLKGLGFQGKETSLSVLLEKKESFHGRERLGIEILEKLFAERKLYAAAVDGFKELTKFKPELFFRICTEAGFIQTRSGQIIHLDIVRLSGHHHDEIGIVVLNNLF